MNSPKLSPTQKKIAELLLGAGGDPMSIDELASATGLNKGALSKALAAMRGWALVSDGRSVSFGPQANQEFGEYDPSGVGKNIRRYWSTKNAAALLGAELLVRQLRGTQCGLAFDNGTTVATFYRHFADGINALLPNRPHLSIVALNPVVVGEALKHAHQEDKIVVIGGSVDTTRCSIVGNAVLRALKEDNHQFDWTILSVARASIDGTLGQPSDEMLEQKQELINRSSHVLILLNEEKIMRHPDKGCRPLFGQIRTVEHIVSLPHRPTVAVVIALEKASADGYGREMHEQLKDVANVSIHLADQDGREIR